MSPGSVDAKMLRLVLCAAFAFLMIEARGHLFVPQRIDVSQAYSYLVCEVSISLPATKIRNA